MAGGLPPQPGQCQLRRVDNYAGARTLLDRRHRKAKRLEGCNALVTVHARQPCRVTQADFDRWSAVPAAVAVDLGQDIGQIDPALRALNPPARQPRLFGRAVTAQCEPPDFGAVLHALDVIAAGDILVIAAGGHAAHAMIGEILGGQLRRRGGRGLVCDGAVRDVAALAGWADLPVFTRHVTPRGPAGTERGSVNVTVTVGGRRVTPGDLIIGDDDGLAVIPEAAMTVRIAQAEDKLRREAAWVASLTGGMSVADTFGL